MIKETIVVLAFGATLVEKHPQPDILHKNYCSINEIYNAVRVYGNMQINQLTNNTACSFSTMLITKSI